MREWLKKNATRLFMGGMVLVLAGRGYMWWMENQSQTASGELPKPQQIQEPQNILDEKNMSFKLVADMISPMPELQTKSYAALTRFNMFDPRMVTRADSLITQANQFVQQADQALKAGQLDQAQQLLDQAFQVNPSQANGLKLKADIAAAKAKAAAAATSATLAGGATPAPGAPPAPGATPAAGGAKKAG